MKRGPTSGPRASRPSVPVGVRSLGGVNYGDVIAEADQQADLKLSKQRFVDPLSGGDDGRKTHVYATLEEALAASKPGDEIVTPLRRTACRWRRSGSTSRTFRT